MDWTDVMKCAGALLLLAMVVAAVVTLIRLME